MKTQPLRQDKHCLNCGTEVPERYCTHCGQENAVPHESFGHLVKHFVGDVLHYDSQFLLTLKYLLFRPGRLTKEYMAGKRVTYVNPIKLYIFISFIFFLVLAVVTHEEEEYKPSKHKQKRAHEKVKDKDQEIPSVTDIVSTVNDSVRTNLKKQGIDVASGASIAKVFKDSLVAKKPEYSSREAYDSAQQQLPPDKRDSKWERLFIHRAFYLDQNYKDDALWETVKHNLPKMMFMLLPIFALMLKLIYNWKRWYYTDHAIFSLHVHCFAFVLLLVTLLLDRWFDSDAFTGWGILLIILYLVLALKNTYQQSFRRSFAKAMLLLFCYSFSAAFIFAFFVVLVFAVIL